MTINISFSSNVKQTDFILGELSYYFNRLCQLSVKESKQAADLTLEIVEDTNENDIIEIELLAGKGHIKANSQIALLIAVYRLFKEMGVRYLRPGREYESFPAEPIALLEQRIVISETAAYKHRGVCIEGATSFDNVKAFIDWLPKISMNSFFIQFENPYTFLKRWYVHENNPYQAAEEFSIEMADQMSLALDQEMLIRGLQHHRVGHGWISEVLGYSSKYGWETEVDLPEEKKAYVAQLNGERDLFLSAPLMTSLDFAHPEVNKQLVAEIVNYAKNRQDVDYLHVWLSDARNNICECDICQTELVSDQYVRLLNELDEALTRENIETKICFLLYHELLLAPEQERLINHDRFAMMFAPISRTFEKSYADVDYEEIPATEAYVRNKMRLPNSLEENLSYLFEWQKTFSGDSFVYDYPLGRAHYGDLGYMNISQIIHKDIQFLDKLGLNGYISCQELRAGFPHNFPNYVMGEMLWHKDLELEELKAEYFQAMYGQQWQAAVKYLETLSTLSSCDYFNGLGERENADLSVAYQEAVTLAKDQLSLIEVQIIATALTQKEDWLQLAHHRDYVMKLGQALHFMSAGDTEKSLKEWHNFLDYIRRNEQQFQSHLDVYRVTEVASNYAGFKE